MKNSIEKYIDETNNLIEAMLEVVMPDFSQITKLVKTVNGTIKDCDQHVMEAHSQIVSELQYYDTLTQKMQHIIKVHGLVIAEVESSVAKTRNSGVNLIRLNHLQFQVACFEYLSSVNHIQTNLRICITCESFPQINVDTIFQYSGILLTASRKINEHFASLEKMCRSSNVDLLSKVDTINRIYSMEGERDVLNAYINKPTINDKEIETIPIANKKESEIDLF
jgi:hypothetical protein